MPIIESKKQFAKVIKYMSQHRGTIFVTQSYVTNGLILLTERAFSKGILDIICKDGFDFETICLFSGLSLQESDADFTDEKIERAIHSENTREMIPTILHAETLRMYAAELPLHSGVTFIEKGHIDILGVQKTYLYTQPDNANMMHFDAPSLKDASFGIMPSVFLGGADNKLDEAIRAYCTARGKTCAEYTV